MNDLDLRHQDAVSLINSLAAGSVDLCITDFPYESLEKHRAIGTTTRLKNKKIMFFERGKRALNTHNYTDVLQYQSLRGKQYSPAEKPVELLQVLVEQSSNPGDWVLDPFMGSGSTGEAALLAGRRFLGGDTSEEAVSISWTRLEALAYYSAWLQEETFYEKEN